MRAGPPTSSPPSAPPGDLAGDECCARRACRGGGSDAPGGLAAGARDAGPARAARQMHLGAPRRTGRSAAGPNAARAGRGPVRGGARTGRPAGLPAGAMCVRRLDGSLGPCNSHHVSHVAAFFIDAGAKRSVAGGCALGGGLWAPEHSERTLLRRRGRAACGHHGLERRREGEGKSLRGAAAPLPLVMIPPLVHQRRPCYDFYFL